MCLFKDDIGELDRHSLHRRLKLARENSTPRLSLEDAYRVVVGERRTVVDRARNTISDAKRIVEIFLAARRFRTQHLGIFDCRGRIEVSETWFDRPYEMHRQRLRWAATDPAGYASHLLLTTEHDRCSLSATPSNIPSGNPARTPRTSVSSPGTSGSYNPGVSRGTAGSSSESSTNCSRDDRRGKQSKSHSKAKKR